SFAGAAWGWRVAKRLKEQHGGERLWCLVAGWLAIVASAAFLATIALATVTVLMLILEPSSRGVFEVVYVLMISSIGCLLIMPMWRLERAARKVTPPPGILPGTPSNITAWEPCTLDPLPLRFNTIIVNLMGVGLLLMPLLVKRAYGKLAAAAKQQQPGG